MSGGLASRVQARAGNGDWNVVENTGGAGTIYLFNTTSSQYGDLIVNNTGVDLPQNARTTLVPSVGNGTIAAISQDPSDFTLWSMETSATAGFSYSPEGGYIILNNGLSESPRYRILGRSGQNNKVIFFRVENGQVAPSSLGIQIGHAYSGAYQLDSVAAKGGARIVFSDPVHCQNISVTGTGSQVVAPNLP
jgi:hypothetical protein